MSERYMQQHLLTKEQIISSFQRDPWGALSVHDVFGGWNAEEKRECLSHSPTSTTHVLSFLYSQRGLLSHSPPPVFHHSHRTVALLALPCISPKSPLWRWKNIIWAQFPDRLPLSLSDGPPKAIDGGSVYPSTHLSLNTKQTVTQPLHLSAPVSGTCLLGKDN